MRPSISVVVPAFNVELYIDAAITSLLEQTVAFDEIIVVNDGSTDSTPFLLKKYADRQQIKLISTENKGLGCARNEGLRHTSSDYVYFFDADDLVVPDFVAVLAVDLCAHPSTELLFFSGSVFFDQSVDIRTRQFQSENEYVRGVSAFFNTGLEAFSAMRATGRFCPSACLYVFKKTLWQNEICFKSIVHEDADHIIMLLAAARATRVLDVALFKRRVRLGSIMTSPVSQKNLAGYLQAFDTARRVKKCTSNRHAYASVAQYLSDMAWLYLNACEKAGIKPSFRNLLFLSMHAQFRVIRNFSRLFIPPKIYFLLRRVRQRVSRVLGVRTVPPSHTDY
jgi:glycosyltransferase involved in cell wall biosynthesis